jgi:hypothetical protein
LKRPSTQTQIAETLEDVQVTLEVLVAHLGLEQRVQSAIGIRRISAARARAEMERALGRADDPDGDSRR